MQLVRVLSFTLYYFFCLVIFTPTPLPNPQPPIFRLLVSSFCLKITNYPTFYQLFTWFWPVLDQGLLSIWPALDQYLINIWSAFYQYLVVFDQFLINILSVFDQYFVVFEQCSTRFATKKWSSHCRELCRGADDQFWLRSFWTAPKESLLECVRGISLVWVLSINFCYKT